MEETMRDKLHPGSDSPDEQQEQTSSPAEESPEEEEPVVVEEILDLNDQLDQISHFLDDLEQKNDNLQDKLRQLLALSKEERLAALAEQMSLAEDLQQEQNKSPEES